MAVQAQYGGLGGVPAVGCGNAPAGDEAVVEAQVRAMRDYGALLAAAVAAANGGGYGGCAVAVVSGAESELTCNGGAAAAVGRKRGREVEQGQYGLSSAALLPIPGMGVAKAVAVAQPAGRLVESAVTSTSGRPAVATAAAVGSFAGALASELYRQNAEIDAVVRMECERLRAGLEQGRKRQCLALVRAASSSAARRLREKDAELEAARRRAAELEERLRQAASESQAWCGVARSNEAVAAGLRATLDHVLLRAAAAAPPPAEGFGDSDGHAPLTAADDAQSCFQANNDGRNDDGAAAATTSPAGGKWSCKCCGEREASVLLLPCRHLCLCKACEPRLDACPVCLAAKNASIHIATV